MTDVALAPELPPQAAQSLLIRELSERVMRLEEDLLRAQGARDALRDLVLSLQEQSYAQTHS